MNNLLSHKRRLSARLLLAVFVPMLLLASLHRHESPVTVQDTSCYDCVHHVHHNGHLSANPQHAYSCVLCSFLTLPYLTPPAVAVLSPCSAHYAFVPRYSSRIAVRPQLHKPGRAPPVVRYCIASTAPHAL